MDNFNLYYKKIIEDNFEENLKTSKEFYNYLDNSTAKYKGQTIYALYMAKAFPGEVIDYLKESSEKMYGILVKVIKKYLADEQYRKLFGFKKELEDLILIPSHYDSFLPISRLDIFLNEKDLSFKFCEFNADGSSSMNEDREINNAFKHTQAYKQISREYEVTSFELFDTWAETFLNIYSTYKYRVDKPNIAIVDFLEKGCSIEEFTEFKNAFIKKGCNCEIAEIGDLVFKEGKLFTKTGMEINAVYRRAVTTDIMEKYDEVKNFISGVKEGKVCLVGGFFTHIIHDKVLFKILNDERTYTFLTDDEIDFIKEHIPLTKDLTTYETEKYNVYENKDKFLIKPRDSYGAKGVYAGVTTDSEKWKRIIDENKDKDYILQEFVTPYRSYNIDFKKKEPQFELYSNLTGMYMYNGVFSGLYSRQSIKEIISTDYDENDLASIVVNKTKNQ